MSELHLRLSERTRPLVAVVCAVPLLGEAMMSALDFAEVRSFSVHGGDVTGLLESLRPDAVVVDSEDGAAGAMSYAAHRALPVLRVCVRERTLSVLRDGVWERVDDEDGPTPEAIRNRVAGALFAREGVR